MPDLADSGAAAAAVAAAAIDDLHESKVKIYKFLCRYHQASAFCNARDQVWLIQLLNRASPLACPRERLWRGYLWLRWPHQLG